MPTAPKPKADSRAAARPDLDSRERVDAFIDAFYGKVLADPVLAPIFLRTAAIDLQTHLPRIKAYWAKLLLGEPGYRRHTMNIHRALHADRPLSPPDFRRWLGLFTRALEERHAGPQTERAKRLAAAIAANMARSLGAEED